jgi:hypothetical protein
MASFKKKWGAPGVRCVGIEPATHRKFKVITHRFRTHVYRRFQGRRRVRQAMIKTTMDTYSDSGPTTLLWG